MSDAEQPAEPHAEHVLDIQPETPHEERVRDDRRRAPRRNGINAEIQDIKFRLQEQQNTLEVIKNALSTAFSLNGAESQRLEPQRLESRHPFLADEASARAPRRSNNNNNNGRNYNKNHQKSGDQNYGGGRGGYGRRYSQRQPVTPPFDA